MDILMTLAMLADKIDRGHNHSVEWGRTKWWMPRFKKYGGRIALVFGHYAIARFVPPQAI